MNKHIASWAYAVKQAIRRRKGSSNPAVKLGFSFYYRFQRICRFCTNPEYRSTRLTQWFHPQDVQQTTVLTGMNRYPKIFTECRDYLRNKNGVKLLSFGCSTGAEVLTLRQYFPDAEIVGADINARNLKECKKLNVDDRITFIFSDDDLIRRHGPYDAVFCMAVLQRTPHTIAEKKIDSLKAIYPFQKFEAQVQKLDHYVKSGGLLVIHFAHYSLWDTEVARGYKALDVNDECITLGMEFDRESRLKPRQETRNSIFVKQTTEKTGLKTQ